QLVSMSAARIALATGSARSIEMDLLLQPIFQRHTHAIGACGSAIWLGVRFRGRFRILPELSKVIAKWTRLRASKQLCLLLQHYETGRWAGPDLVPRQRQGPSHGDPSPGSATRDLQLDQKPPKAVSMRREPTGQRGLRLSISSPFSGT